MTKEQREEQFRKILENATSGKIKNCGNITSWKFSMEEKDIKKFLDFIESEVEKAKKEGEVTGWKKGTELADLNWKESEIVYELSDKDKKRQQELNKEWEESVKF